MSVSEAPLADARARLRAAASVGVLTGAGMSAESGIPTFRDALTGLWSRFDPMRLASEEGFRADPALRGTAATMLPRLLMDREPA